jgi:enoyl-CoA hydratase/carnithine racemase
MPPTPATVAVEDADEVRRIILRRPPVNALSLTEYEALADAFDVDAAEDGAPRVVLLRAEGRAWCAGQDLRELGTLAEAPERKAYLVRATRGVAAAARCPLPVVTVLDGPAVGAGALLVACSDIVVATPEGSVAFPEVRLGLRLGRALLAGVLPDPVVTHAFATGHPIDAARLHQWGMVAELVSAADVPTRTERVLADLLALSDGSLAWLRRRPRRARLAEAYLDEVAKATAGW